MNPTCLVSGLGRGSRHASKIFSGRLEARMILATGANDQ